MLERAASEGGRSVGEENFFFSASDLRHDPSTLIFGIGLPFAGNLLDARLRALGERRSQVDVENVVKALQAFIAPAPTTEGARGFRRRGAHAHRSPGDGARQKRAAERSKCVGPLLGGLGPCCLHRCKACKLPTSLWASSSQLLDVTAFPIRALAEKLGKNPGKRKRRKASRGAPQTMPQKARLLQ